MKKERVFIGLSGGVDSAVAAHRLIEAGHEVVGVFIKVWQPDFLECNWERERLDAMRVAAHLDIPFLTFNAAEIYEREVVTHMIAEYKEGRTPNPDVMCNQYVKFGAFLEFAKKNGAHKIATGHYAQIQVVEGAYRLSRGADTAKDQSYFLWTLTEEQLSQIYFPVGDSQKRDIRKTAERCGLPVSHKADSQGICFLGKIDFKEFLSHYVPLKKGEVLNEVGRRIGEHDGAIFYTLGQRHGFKIHVQTAHGSPYYVTGKDIEKNTITVSVHPRTVTSGDIRLVSVNYLRGSLPAELKAQFRYRQQPFDVRIKEGNEQYVMLSVLNQAIEAPSSGQSCVLYDQDECVAGGIIM